MADEFKPTDRGDVDDLALLPRRFELFASEVRQSFEMLGDKILPALTRIEEAVIDLGERVSRLERDAVEVNRRIAALEQKVSRRVAVRRKG